jgi:hypothetical protein
MAHTFLSQYHVLRIVREKQVVSIKENLKTYQSSGKSTKKERFPFLHLLSVFSYCALIRRAPGGSQAIS